jgi:hypothetical protein
VARLIGPSEASRLVFTIVTTSGVTKGLFKSKALRPATFYNDPDPTAPPTAELAAQGGLADILTEAGAAIADSTVTIDPYSTLPLIQFPDGDPPPDSLIIIVDGGPAWRVYAREDDRLDALREATRLAQEAAEAAQDAADAAQATASGAETPAGAQAKADAAQAAAISASSTDATSKANAAQSAAISAAGTDATTKANAAQSAAISAAAADATTKANAAQAAAVQRANHTGAQAISTVTGLQAALDSKTPRVAVVVGAAGSADHTTLAAALTAVGSTAADIYVTSAVTLAGNTTIPVTTTVYVTRSGSIGLGGFTLTFNGGLSANRHQVFTGSGSVTFNSGSVLCVFPEWWGAQAGAIGTTPSTDSGPAITAAVASVKAAGGIVDQLPGNYKVLTTVDASNIQASQSFHISPKTVTLRGAGSRRTYWTGGETGYGFLELVGSNYIRVEGITLQQSTSGVQYGILTGRPVGNGSSGIHQFNDVHLYGAYGVAAVFALASEVCSYDGLSIYTTAGKPVVIAKDIGGWTIAAKYTGLSPTTPYGGGNGVIRMVNSQLQTSSANPADCALLMEFMQTLLIENLYVYTHNANYGIVMQRRSHDATFINVHQEFQNTEPRGIYYSAVEDAGVTPQFTNQTFIGCRMYGIEAADTVVLSNVLFRGTLRGTGAHPYIIDVYDAVDFDIHSIHTSISPEVGGISQANLKYRVRNSNSGNSWGAVPAANLTVPTPAADNVSTRSATETYSNKRVVPRVSQATTTATLIVNFDSSDVHVITAQSGGLAISVGGTPTAGQAMVLRIKDDGTSRALTWAANFRGLSEPLPAATIPGETLYLTFRYNAADAKIDLVSVARNGLYNPGSDLLAAGEFVPGREFAVSASVSHSSGTQAMTFFTARRTQQITTLTAYTGSTAAGATPSLVRYGVWEIDSAGAGTLVASTPNDTALLAAANTPYPKALSAPWAKVAGQRYAVGVLVVSAAAMPNYVGQLYTGTAVNLAWLAEAPRQTGRLIGVSDLTNFADADLTVVQTKTAMKLS